MNAWSSPPDPDVRRGIHLVRGHRVHDQRTSHDPMLDEWIALVAADEPRVLLPLRVEKTAVLPQPLAAIPARQWGLVADRQQSGRRLEMVGLGKPPKSPALRAPARRVVRLRARTEHGGSAAFRAGWSGLIRG